MADIDAALAANREAASELIAAADRCAGVWATPPEAGKWSPSQIVEHVARAMEESANVVAGAPSKFPTLPRLLRPILRGLFFNRTLRKKTFSRARTGKAFDPEIGPPSPAAARVRLEAALASFDRACRARAGSGRPVESTVFGTVSLEDYARFQALHIHHHRRQMPDA